MEGARRNHDFSYTPAEAARMLRVSPTRVRQLLQEGELHGERDAAGHWLIPAHVVHQRLERLRHESFSEAVGYDPSIVHAMQERVEVLRDQVELLRAELQEAHAANRENRRIIAALTSRIPAIEAPSEPRERPDTAAQELHQHLEEEVRETPSEEPPESPETATEEETGRGTEPPDQQRPGVPRRPQERSSLWQRLFGG